MLNKALVLFGVISLVVCSVLFGKWLEKPTLDDLAERNRAWAQLDTVRLIELEDSRKAYVRLTYDFNNAEKSWAFVNDSLNNVANALRRKAQEDGRTIETLVTANAKLMDSLDVVLRGIVVTDSVVTAEIYMHKGYQDGSILVDGLVSIWTPVDDEPWGAADLAFDIQMTPTVLLSRDEDTGLASCAISFGDMPVYVDELSCVNNWDVDLPTGSKITLPSVALGSAITLGVIGVLLLVF